jgi:hypothetical protein
LGRAPALSAKSRSNAIDTHHGVFGEALSHGSVDQFLRHPPCHARFLSSAEVEEYTLRAGLSMVEPMVDLEGHNKNRQVVVEGSPMTLTERG